MGRIFFSIGAFLTTSLVNYGTSSHHKENPDHHHHQHGNNHQRHHHRHRHGTTKEQQQQQRSLQAEHDRITKLPGLNYEPGFEQFAGYLDVAPTRHVFYWYVESQSDPANDPVVLWTK
jgi:carboxypeptidase C (cathepsin A)